MGEVFDFLYGLTPTDHKLGKIDVGIANLVYQNIEKPVFNGVNFLVDPADRFVDRAIDFHATRWISFR